MSSNPPGRPERLFYSPVPAGNHPGLKTGTSTNRGSGAGGGSGPGPSILVVGETVPGLVLAALLERGSASPTLVSRHRNEAGATSAVTLAPPAASTVDHLADADSAIDSGLRVDELAVVDGDGRRTYATAESGASALRIDRTSLLDRLRRAVSRSNRRRTQVERIHQVEDGVVVTFGDDERSTYDLVVGADGPNSFLGTLTGNPRDIAGGVHEWTVGVDRLSGWTGDLVEYWDRDAILTATPFGDELAVRLGVAVDDDRNRLPIDVADDALAGLGGPLATPVGNALPNRSDYRRVPDPTADPTWRIDRVAFCGDAAVPLGPLSGLAPSLGVEDAVTLAESLWAADSVDDALDRYSSRRETRLSAIFDAARSAFDGEESYPPTLRDGPLGTVAGLRTLGNARFLGIEDPFADGDWSPEHPG